MTRATQDLTQARAADVTQDVTRDVTQDLTQDVTRDVTQDLTQDVTRDVTQDLTQDVTRDVTQDLTQDVTRDVTQDLTQDVTRDVTQDLTQDVTRDVTQDLTQDVTRDVTQDVTRDVARDMTLEVVPRPKLPDETAGQPGQPKEIIPLGPADGFPRRIAHNETVRYSYDPATDKVTAELVSVQDQPDVLVKDTSPPDGRARGVASLTVTPAGRQLAVDQDPEQDAPPVPDDITASLRRQSEASGGAPVSIDATTRYVHDLDTHDTQASEVDLDAEPAAAGAPAPSARERALAYLSRSAETARTRVAPAASERAREYLRRSTEAARSASTKAQAAFPETSAAIRERLTPAPRAAKPTESFDAKLARFMKNWGAQNPPKAQAKSASNRRRSSGGKNKDLKKAPYQQPTVIVVREAPGTGGRRYGRL